jgi:uncharacterized protein (TIGR02246 family)
MLMTIASVMLAALGITSVQVKGVPADARATIAKANAEWIPALKARDAATIAAPYADDGIFVTATGDVIKGRDAVAQLMRDRIAQMGTVISGTIVQDGLTRQGTSIYEWGHAVLELAHEGAPAQHSGGRYLTVWQKSAAGRWVIVRNLSFAE